MDLKAEIQQAVKAAMKGGDTVTLSTLRLLLAALQNEEIRLRRALNTEEIELYRKGGRQELAVKEEAELAILKGFLPQQLSDEEIKSAIQASIDEAGASGPADLGKVMKLAMPKVAGRSDGKRVSDLAKALLGG
jgi:uncharacterized protein YqeY